MRVLALLMLLAAGCSTTVKEVKTQAQIHLAPGEVCYAQKRTMLPNGDIKIETAVVKCPKKK